MISRQIAHFPSTELVTLCLSGCFSTTQYVGMGSWLNGLGKVCAAPYLLICGRLAPGPETEQGLERGHGLPAPIVAKDEFIKINLKLIAAHAVIGSDQPLLEIPNGAVRQRQHRLRAFAQIDSQGLRARHMLKSGLLQPRKALETVGVYSRTQHYIFFQETEERCTFEIRDDKPFERARLRGRVSPQPPRPARLSVPSVAGFPSIRPESRQSRSRPLPLRRAAARVPG